MAKTVETEAKKYRILESFTYKGKDGKSVPPITLGPGEDVPELNASEREKLLDTDKICEISDTGENVLRKAKAKECIELSEAQLNYLMPNAKTLQFLKQNRLTEKSLAALKDKITEAISKYNLQPSYYIEETLKAIDLQFSELAILPE